MIHTTCSVVGETLEYIRPLKKEIIYKKQSWLSAHVGYRVKSLCISMSLLLFTVRVRVEHEFAMAGVGRDGMKVSQCSMLESMLNSVYFMCVSTCTSGAKYSLLAYTTLSLSEAEGSFQSHSLIVLQDGKKQRHRNVISGDIRDYAF